MSAFMENVVLIFETRDKKTMKKNNFRLLILLYYERAIINLVQF